MAKRKTRRHPGVVLIKPDPKHRAGWRVRYRDPDSGRMVKRTIDPGLRTRAQREGYACKLSEKLVRRRLELETGAVRMTGTPVAEAVELYFQAHPGLRPRTLKEYRRATAKLVAWCHKHGIRTADDLDRRRLMQFRESVINEPKQRSGTGRRGAKVRSGDRRADRTINKELTSIGTTLRYLVKRQEFSKLHRDDVDVACEHYGKGTSETKQPLKVRELRGLLDACIDHDEATFEMTRAEAQGRGTAGSTLRYEPIGPFVAFCLLSGVRPGEARRIDWSLVDFDDAVIHIPKWSKTRRERRVTMAESPALRRLLEAQYQLTGVKGSIWALTEGQALAARKRLIEAHDAPKRFGWQLARVTCQSYLASSPSIFGGASIFLTAQRGGHSVQVCEKYYANAVNVADPDATTIEGAMGIEEHVDQIIADLEALEVAA